MKFTVLVSKRLGSIELLLVILVLTGCRPSATQVGNDKSSNVKEDIEVAFELPETVVPNNLNTFNFPGYFAISYPSEWKINDSPSIPFSCSLLKEGNPIALVYATIRKQSNFEEYTETVIKNSGKTPVKVPVKVDKYPAIYFYVSDESSTIKNLIVNRDNNTIIHFSFQLLTADSRIKKDVEVMEKTIRIFE